MKQLLIHYLRKIGLRLGFERDWYLYLVAAVIGVFMGLAAVGFILPLRKSEQIAEIMEGSEYLWLLILLGPAVGGLITGILIAILKHEGVGPGVTSVIYAVQRRKGKLSWKIGIRKWLASTATIASGGSAGAEGPIVTIGAVVGSNIAKLLGTGSQHTGTLLGCGAAAGLASVFNAPIAGIFFVMEILLRDFSLKTFTPIVIAAVVSSATTQGILGDAALFQVEEGFFRDGLAFSVTQIPTYLLLGLACGLLGAAFVKTLDYSERFFVATKLPLVARPVLGALLLGILGITIYLLTNGDSVPMFYGNGYPMIGSFINPNNYFSDADSLVLRDAVPFIFVLAGLAFVKLIATSITVGSGGAGGLFAPSLFIGAATGGCIGYAVHYLGWFPNTSPAYFALVGMAAMVAATTHAPLTAILIVYEVTQSYDVILPLMFAAVVSTVVARYICRDSVYTFKLTRLGVRMGALSDLTILRRLTPEDIELEKAIIVKRSDSAQRLVELMESDGTSDFVVTDDFGKYCGMVTSADLRDALVYREAIPLLQVSELQRSELPTIGLEETLDLVLDKFSRSDVQALVLLTNSGDISGLITRAKLMKRYQQALSEDAN
ncbi:MAG TPA: CBS domain-containing protein [Phycisphaerales bacterium]|nr:CBS domain-containing protein [Phycisphaerales bacterium]HIB50134.1 CBS domain-containing protein [Phycisphaerales bacterium]HIN83771.1 CBS domain-containing protein [Phycisphaerales bacterium]HIO20390.1 CBS domain-containing protein [Phycisphaerales bacterium]HIO53472.1 CBS domain-containing protein [Phycisphaerales bacterium]